MQLTTFLYMCLKQEQTRYVYAACFLTVSGDIWVKCVFRGTCHDNRAMLFTIVFTSKTRKKNTHLVGHNDLFRRSNVPKQKQINCNYMASVILIVKLLYGYQYVVIWGFVCIRCFLNLKCL